MSNHTEAAPRKSLFTSLTSWLDAGAGLARFDSAKIDNIDWLRVIPFIGMHIACVAVLFVGVSPIAAGVAIGMYVIRMFAITGFYHRYFSHRSFKTSRAGQFVFALLGASAVQRGPIWWAAHHRHHRSRRAVRAPGAGPAHDSLADAGVGLLRVDGGDLSRHLHHQLAVSSLR
jgi:stearoyl-CoA desaturase (delta-9 desaturase)